MRLIKTFVMHLYFDSDAPARIHGDVRLLLDYSNHTFYNQLEFEVLLHQVIDKSFRINPVTKRKIPPIVIYYS
jgi:hypothetical protein